MVILKMCIHWVYYDSKTLAGSDLVKSSFNMHKLRNQFGGFARKHLQPGAGYRMAKYENSLFEK